MAKKPKKSKRFRYNLKSVLKYRYICEEKEKEKFAEAEKKYKEELRKEEELKNQEIAERAGLVLQIKEGLIDFQQVNMRKAHLETLKVKIIEQIKVREEAEEAKELQREALVQAMKETKILEEDKKKKKEAWKELMKKEEIKFLDEISTIGFVRKQNMEIEEEKRIMKKKAANKKA